MKHMAKPGTHGRHLKLRSWGVTLASILLDECIISLARCTQWVVDSASPCIPYIEEWCFNYKTCYNRDGIGTKE